MADETTDSSIREQVVICFRCVDNSLSAHEEFIGRQQVDRIDAATISFHNIIKIRHLAHQSPVTKSKMIVL